jgi:sugar fermentation stimulation protein A
VLVDKAKFHIPEFSSAPWMKTQLLTLQYDVEAEFRARPNRFLGLVTFDDQETQTHIHDPGRLKELLYPGNQVLLKRADNPNRKTRWDLIAAKKNNKWILVHSGYHRAIVENILKHPKLNPYGKLSEIKPEVPVGHSRLDFLLTKPNGTKIYAEVKGCTLTIAGTALFPDAPTERGTRHLKTLISLVKPRTQAAIIILVFRPDSKCFAPNIDTDKKFGETFKMALEHGITAHPIVLSYNGKHIMFEKTIPVCPNL